jgi:4-amino-4-deoxy-L-arabinose transferase-like glycosyltransferase
MAGLVVGVLLILWAAFFHGLAILYPVDKTEALQIAIARQMAVSGDWVTAMVNGRPYFEKPPLPYWIGALLLQHWPAQLWLPRLGSTLAGMAAVLATVLLSGLAGGDRPWRRGLVAGGLLALMPGELAMARTAVHDSYLAASSTAALAIVFLVSQGRFPGQGRRALRWLAGGLTGACLGLGLLAKGLLSLVIPCSTALLFLALAGPQCRRRCSRGFLAALLGSLVLVALPWHLAAWQANGALFLNGYFGRSHLARVASTLDGHAGPWYYYLPAYLLLSFPWAPLAIAGLGRHGLDPRQWRRRATDQPLLLFCTVWIVLTLGLLSLASTKLPHYILPALPPTAIAAATWLTGSSGGPRPGRSAAGPERLPQVMLLGMGALLLAGGAALAVTPQLLVPLSDRGPAFSLALRQQLAAPAVWLTLLSLGVVSTAAGLRPAAALEQQRLRLAVLLTLPPLLFLLLLSPPLLHLYRDLQQQPRLTLTDAVLPQLQSGERIEVVSREWYSVILRSGGRARISRVDDVLPSGGDGITDQGTTDTLVVMAPERRLRQITAHLGPGELLAAEPSQPTLPQRRGRRQRDGAVSVVRFQQQR